ncbi:hypothetical protein HYFRA_00010894 [Hymenoscyphus fraxineus]|uniref:Uncharacterized protein n=1 Tax=Hymenoscyphus fraxineus TaxID=746836 RepID=A0A9N9PSY7_9HELO|nr:hypothetical protein HYFRA_00010894 [Hymenoscyphus fraxineus]
MLFYDFFPLLLLLVTETLAVQVRVDYADSSAATSYVKVICTSRAAPEQYAIPRFLTEQPITNVTLITTDQFFRPDGELIPNDDPLVSDWMSDQVVNSVLDLMETIYCVINTEREKFSIGEFVCPPATRVMFEEFPPETKLSFVTCRFRFMFPTDCEEK